MTDNGQHKKQIDELIRQLHDESTNHETKEMIRAWLWSNASSHLKEQSLVENFGRLEPNMSPDAYELHKYARQAKSLGIFSLKKTKSLRWTYLVKRIAFRAAAVLIPVAVAFGVWALYDNTQEQPPQVAQVVTVSAYADETKDLVLSDGTEVRLAGGSELTYEEGFADGRSVKLKGAARFDVKKVADEQGVALPFTVATNTITVNVHGTVFRVDEYPGSESSTVALYEGSVSVENGGAVRLRRGDLYRYDHNYQAHTIGIIPAREMLDNGQKPMLRFDCSPMSDMMLSLESNFGVRFAVPQGFDRSAGGISGDFEGLAIGDIVHILTVTDKIYAYNLGGNTITITNKKMILDD